MMLFFRELNFKGGGLLVDLKLRPTPAQLESSSILHERRCPHGPFCNSSRSLKRHRQYIREDPHEGVSHI